MLHSGSSPCAIRKIKIRQKSEKSLDHYKKLKYKSKMEKVELTADLVRRVLDYDPDTGAFTWRDLSDPWFDDKPYRRKKGNAYAGKRAMNSNQIGYRCGGILGDIYLAHRVAWLHYYGYWPTKTIDHLNHDRADNRIVNLRDVPHGSNLRNQPVRKNNKTGATGVWPTGKNKWRATITRKGKEIRLGKFDTFEEAVAARKEAEWVYGFHENHGVGNAKHYLKTKKAPLA